MDIEFEIRKLAKSFYYQSLYNGAREIGHLQLFDNKDNLSGLQILFLRWVQIYNMLYKELSEKEWLNLDEEVIKSDIRTDAFLYWRQREIEKQLIRYKEEMKKTNQKSSMRNKGKGESLPVWSGKK